MPPDLAQLVTELGAAAQWVEGASVLLERGQDHRSRRDRKPGDERVQAVGRRLRERDASRALRVAQRSREVRPGRLEGGVVRGVSDVTEHAHLVQPRAESLGRALRNWECGTRAGDVEIERVAAQRLQGRRRGVRAFVDERGDVGRHAVMMPRITSPAVKSAAKPSATDWPRGARSRTSDAARGIARTTANP